MRKRMIISVLFILSVMFALSGCGESGSAGSDGSESAGSGQISFVATDLEGNEVNSEELFASSEVTMINIWGTFCGPCIEEMPELEKIHQEYADKGAAIVGLVIDAPAGDEALTEEAKRIVKETGVTYPSLLAWEGVDSQLAANAVPTTYFVDSEGNLIGDPIIGADPEGYRNALDQLLQ